MNGSESFPLEGRSAEEIPWEGIGRADQVIVFPGGTRLEIRTLRVGPPDVQRRVTDMRIVKPTTEQNEVVDDKKDSD